jgi:ferredoxin--NADP+ reductase
MEVGDAIDVSEKATGSFTLSHVPDADCIWLLATGTGLAPYIAMLREAVIWNRFPKIVLAHGVRYVTDLGYQEELAQFANQYPDRFQFIPVISRQSVEGAISGRITTAIESGTLESKVGIAMQANNSAVMMCGNPQMLDDVEHQLHSRSMTKHKPKTPGNYVVERYW